MSILDFDKVQTDYLKASLKTSHKGGMCAWFLSHDEEGNNTYLSDGHFIAIVPDAMCFVKSNGREINPDSLKKNFTPSYELKVITDTGLSIAVAGTKETAHIFKLDEDEIWINEKYLAYFAKMPVRYMGTGRRAPVMLF